MAKLKSVVASLSEVDEKFHDLYAVSADGKFRLDADGYEDVSGLKTALEAERKAARDLQGRFKGIDPEKHAALLKEAEEREVEKAKAAGDFKSLEDKLRADTAKEISAREDRIKALNGSLESHLVDAQATAAIAAAKGSTGLLLPHVKARVKVVEIDGKHVVRVTNEKGEDRSDAKGQPLTIEAYVAEMKASETYGRAFDASTAGGGGMPGAGGGTRSNGTFTLSREDAKNPRTYQAMRAEAAKVGQSVTIAE